MNAWNGESSLNDSKGLADARRERREVGGAGCERLQVRCAGFNGKFGPGFGQLFHAVDPASELAMAA